MTAKEKLEAILNHYSLDLTTLAEVLDLPKHRIFDISRGKTKSIGNDIVNRIISYFGDLNPAWFVSSDAPMIISKGHTTNVGGIQITGRNQINGSSITNTNNSYNKEALDQSEHSEIRHHDTLNRILDVAVDSHKTLEDWQAQINSKVEDIETIMTEQTNRLLRIIETKDEQIARLLTIIENKSK